MDPSELIPAIIEIAEIVEKSEQLGLLTRIVFIDNTFEYYVGAQLAGIIQCDENRFAIDAVVGSYAASTTRCFTVCSVI